jgi:hypothetical protein
MCRHWAVMATLSFVASGCDLLGNEVDVAGVIGSQFVSMTIDESGSSGSFLGAEAALTPERFLPNVQERVGRAATSVDLLRVRLEAGTATGVASWGEVFDNPLTVTFVPATGAPINVATGALVPGLAAIEMDVTTDREYLDQLPDIAAGRFSVRLSGVSARTSDEVFTLPVRVELEFVAF